MAEKPVGASREVGARSKKPEGFESEGEYREWLERVRALGLPEDVDKWGSREETLYLSDPGNMVAIREANESFKKGRGKVLKGSIYDLL